MTTSPKPDRRDAQLLPSRHVLLIEDDPALALMLTWELEDRGVTTALATTCAQARFLSQRIRFELALVDVDLPDGDGLALAEGLAAAYPRATVAIHTGRHGCGPSPFRANALKHVLTKPVPVDHLVGLLNEAESAEHPVPAPSRAAAHRQPSRGELAPGDG